jgi:hypothetical protein
MTLITQPDDERLEKFVEDFRYAKPYDYMRLIIDSLRAALEDRDFDKANAVTYQRMTDRVCTERDAAVKERDIYKDFINGDGNFPCLPECDSFGHDELCPHVNPPQAFRNLRAERDAANAELAKKEGQLCKAREAIHGMIAISDLWVPATVTEEHRGEAEALHHAREKLLAALSSSSPCRHEARVKELENERKAMTDVQKDPP